MTLSESKAKAFDDLIERISSDQKTLEANVRADYLDYVCVLNSLFTYASNVAKTLPSPSVESQ